MSMDGTALKWLTTVGAELRASDATFDNTCGTAPAAVVSGVFCRSLSVCSWCCGVCATTLYCVPFFGSFQNDGEVWKLPDSDTSILLATFCSVRPSSCALLRSTLTLICG